MPALSGTSNSAATTSKARAETQQQARPIRPVCRRFPTSQAVWDATNLPFACVITPLADTTARDSSLHKVSSSLASIPKCLHCGAPHASKDTHFRPRVLEDSNKGYLLCYLCGKTSPTNWTAQRQARQASEGDGAAADDGTQPAASLPTFRTTSLTIPDPTIFQLPLRFQQQQQSTASTALYSIPAIACPPLWFVLLDGTCSNPAYWHTTSRLLLNALEDVPAHVHVALLIASTLPRDATAGTGTASDTEDDSDDTTTTTTSILSIFQLSSPVPHLKHYSNQDENDRSDILQALVGSFTDGLHRSHLQTALRSLMDYHGGSGSHGQSPLLLLDHHHHHGDNHGYGAGMESSSSSNDSNDNKGIPLAWCVDLLVDAMQTYGQVAGQRQFSSSNSSNDYPTQTMNGVPIMKLPYAGAKLTCLLAHRPQGICREQSQSAAAATSSSSGWLSSFSRSQQQDQASTQFTPAIGMGGFGGRIVELGGAQVANGLSNKAVMAGAELTPSDLEKHYQPFPDDSVLYMDELGRTCAQAAMGVDILCLLSSSSQSSCGSSGGDYDDDHYLQTAAEEMALPLFAHLSTKSGAPGPLLFDLDDAASVSRLERELKSRVPWKEGRVFGAELRLRLPPGFAVDDVAVEPSDDAGPQLAPLYVDAGLMGPASSVDDSKQLWRMGTCDEYTSFAIDLCLTDAIVPRKISVDELGVVALKPVIQTCFAYTTIEHDDETGQYVVKRQMRIHSCPVPFHDDTEGLYNAVDTDALAVVLYHKVAIASFQDGVAEGLNIAADWLISTLVSIYRSAEDYAEQLNGDPPSRDADFMAHERLLDQEGELSTDDVLLAQGHTLLKRLVLMTYQLMECDALRSCQPNFCPSPDLRYATLSQLLSMPPHTLNRCIGPQLQAWLSALDSEEPVVDSVDLRRKSVRMVADEFAKYDDLIWFLDSPATLALLDGSSVEDANGTLKKSTGLVTSDYLQRSINEASRAYRTEPDMIDQLQSAEAKTDGALELLSNVLIRDMPSPSGQANFTKWKKHVAARVIEELEK